MQSPVKSPKKSSEELLSLFRSPPHTAVITFQGGSVWVSLGIAPSAQDNKGTGSAGSLPPLPQPVCNCGFFLDPDLALSSPAVFDYKSRAGGGQQGQVHAGTSSVEALTELCTHFSASDGFIQSS